MAYGSNRVLDNMNDADISRQIVLTSQTDGAKGRRCAEGVRHILTKLGVPHPWADGHQWAENLPSLGWIKLEPHETPPLHSIRAYNHIDPRPSDRDVKAGRATAGQRYGHVDISMNVNGRVQHASDKVRDRTGGTVQAELEGIFVHPLLHAEFLANRGMHNIAKAPITAAEGNVFDAALKTAAVRETFNPESRPVDIAKVITKDNVGQLLDGMLEAVFEPEVLAELSAASSKPLQMAGDNSLDIPLSPMKA